MSRILIPKPNLLDVFVRKPTPSQEEEAVLVDLIKNKDGSWKGVVVSPIEMEMTIGSESKTGGIFTDHDWHPKNWIWYKDGSTWGPVGLIYVAPQATMKYVKEITWQDIPIPMKEEPRLAWERRVKEEMGHDFCALPAFNDLVGECWAASQKDDTKSKKAARE